MDDRKEFMRLYWECLNQLEIDAKLPPELRNPDAGQDYAEAARKEAADG